MTSEHHLPPRVISMFFLRKLSESKRSKASGLHCFTTSSPLQSIYINSHQHDQKE